MQIVALIQLPYVIKEINHLIFVGFMEKSISVIEWRHFEKKWAKNRFSVVEKKVLFQHLGCWQVNAPLCWLVVYKLIDPHRLMRHQLKDDNHDIWWYPCLSFGPHSFNSGKDEATTRLFSLFLFGQQMDFPDSWV